MIPAELVGTWTLIDYWRTRGAQLVRPLGNDPVGFLQYGPDGRVSATLARRERPHFNDPPGIDWRGDRDAWAEAAMSYVAYTGRYAIQGERVEHFVDVSLYPNWTGTTLTRWASFYEVAGERRLLLVTAPPGAPDDDAPVSHLQWRRWRDAEGGAQAS